MERPIPPVPPPVTPQVPPKQQQAAPRRRTSPGWIVGGIALIVVLLIIMFLCGTCFVLSVSFKAARFDGVGLIEVNGVLANGGESVGGTSAESLVEQLYRARKDDRVKAVCLRINSPGGTPAAAQEVYAEVRKTMEVKPVVASIGDLGASAAYYIASASNFIMADPDSDVGSIGVIVEIPNIQQLDTKIGFDITIYTEGEFKDMGSPFRSVTPAEEEIIKSQMKVAYDHFITGVAEGRDMDEGRVRELANGLTYPGTQAKELKLIDEIGNFRDALTRAGRMGGIEGDIHIIEMGGGSLFGFFSEFLKAMKELGRDLNILDKSDSATDAYPVKQ